MKRFLPFIVILLICAAGFLSCGAVSSSYLYPDEAGTSIVDEDTSGGKDPNDPEDPKSSSGPFIGIKWEDGKIVQ